MPLRMAAAIPQSKQFVFFGKNVDDWSTLIWVEALQVEKGGDENATTTVFKTSPLHFAAGTQRVPLNARRYPIGIYKGSEIMKKNVIIATLIAASFAAPTLSFAQASAPVTHASRLAELAQLEKAGYNPGVPDPTYPASLQAAEAKLAVTSGQSTAVVANASNEQVDLTAPR